MVSVGQNLPPVTVYEMIEGKPAPRLVSDLWGQGQHILFGLPGAFTPVCSATHVPSFIQAQEAFRAQGIQEVFCVAVNDVFVLEAWKQALGAPSFVRFIGDGNGELTRALGLEMDGHSLGFGVRCQRFALRIQDGRIAHCAVEETPGSCSVTGGDAVLALLKG